MLSLPFYLSWDSQRASRWAHAHFNGALAKHAQLHGGYIIRHPDIATARGPGLYDPNNQGNLMEIGYLLTIVAPLAVALACQRQPMVKQKAIQVARRQDLQK